VGLWKVYFLGLVAMVLKEWGVETPEAKRVYAALAEAGLSQRRKEPTFATTRRTQLRPACRGGRVRRGRLVLDPNTGMPVGITGKITLGPPQAYLRAVGIVPIDELLEAADEALRELDFSVWLILDRLDVAFVTQEALE
jgi:hypothetical protein